MQGVNGGGKLTQSRWSIVPSKKDFLGQLLVVNTVGSIVNGLKDQHLLKMSYLGLIPTLRQMEIFQV